MTEFKELKSDTFLYYKNIENRLSAIIEEKQVFLQRDLDLQPQKGKEETWEEESYRFLIYHYLKIFEQNGKIERISLGSFNKKFDNRFTKDKSKYINLNKNLIVIFKPNFQRIEKIKKLLTENV